MDGQTERWTDGWTDTQVWNRVMDIQWVRGGQMTDREVDRWMDRGGQMEVDRWMV